MERVKGIEPSSRYTCLKWSISYVFMVDTMIILGILILILILTSVTQIRYVKHLETP